MSVKPLNEVRYYDALKRITKYDSPERLSRTASPARPAAAKGENGMTHTYAVLPVPRAVYAAVRALLDFAGYQHAFHAEARSGGEVIDMHGIALQAKAGPTGTDITVSTLLSSKTKEGRIDFTLNGELTQMDLGKAREVVGMLQGAIEAAISDELMYRFLTQKIGLEPDRASAALIDFREMRQGSREIVYPS